MHSDCQTAVVRRLDILTAQVQALRTELRAALGQPPKPSRRWISTAELAAEINVSTRCIQNWLSAGRFPANTYRTRKRGQVRVYVLDRLPALAAAERIICGEA